MASLATQKTFPWAVTAASDLVGALAMGVMLFPNMTPTTDVANQGGGGARALRVGVAKAMATSTLAEGGDVSGDINAAMSSEHVNPVAAEHGSKFAVPIEEDDQDRYVGEGCKAHVAKDPTGGLAQSGARQGRFNLYLQKKRGRRKDSTVDRSSWHATNLRMNPLLSRDEMGTEEVTGEECQVGNDRGERDVACERDRKVSGVLRGAAFRGLTAPCTVNNTYGVSNLAFDVRV